MGSLRPSGGFPSTYFSYKRFVLGKRATILDDHHHDILIMATTVMMIERLMKLFFERL